MSYKTNLAKPLPLRSKLYKNKGYSYFKDGNANPPGAQAFYKVDWTTKKIYWTSKDIDNCGWIWLNVSEKRMLQLIQEMKLIKSKKELFLELL